MDNKYMNNYMKERWRRRRQNAIVQLGGECADCGSIENLQFHHVNGKEFTIASGSSFSAVRFKEELKKCVLVCVDCHKRKHSMKHGTVNRKCKCDLCRNAYNAYMREWKKNRRLHNSNG